MSLCRQLNNIYGTNHGYQIQTLLPTIKKYLRHSLGQHVYNPMPTITRFLRHITHNTCTDKHKFSTALNNGAVFTAKQTTIHDADNYYISTALN